MHSDDKEEKLIRSVALQNAKAVLLARERAERGLITAKRELERKSAELVEQREFFRVTLSSIGDGVITVDTDARITFLNPAAEAMTGWKSEDAIGQPIEKVFYILNEQNGEPAMSPMTTLLRDGVLVGLTADSVLIARDGTQRAIADSAAPIRDATGKIRGAVMVFHDVTAQHQAQIELRESNQLLRQARDQLENRVQQRTADLKTANENLRDLSGQLLKMQDDERRRLARELHDSVGQLLAAMAMNISAVQSQSHKLDSNGERAVSENARLVQQASSEIRTISHLLHPPLLELAGLVSALRWYVDGYAERSKIKVDLEIPPDFDRLPQDTELAIFRIVQECLTNIHRHSGSPAATIRIHREGGHLLVEITDYGKGIPEGKQRELTLAGRSGVGFSGMRERLRQLGGTLEIHSDKTGTVVKAILRAE